MRIGVLAVQGSVVEHVDAVKRASDGEADIVTVRKPEDLYGVEGLVMPGGESTAIGRLLLKSGLFGVLGNMGREGFPLMGTCAGCVLLSSSLDDPLLESKTPILGLLDISAGRNAFGRQRESFEADIEIDGIGLFPGVFIRAPAINRIWGRSKPIGLFEGRIVAVEQENIIAMSFHPELSGDQRLHGYFLKKVEECSWRA